VQFFNVKDRQRRRGREKENVYGAGVAQSQKITRTRLADIE